MLSIIETISPGLSSLIGITNENINYLNEYALDSSETLGEDDFLLFVLSRGIAWDTSSNLSTRPFPIEKILIN